MISMQRKERIKQNAEKLRQLGVHQAAAACLAASERGQRAGLPEQSRAPRPERQPARRRPAGSQMPSRKSSRIRGGEPSQAAGPAELAEGEAADPGQP